MMIDEKKLDNPVWNSLSETHKNFAVDFRNIKFYHPDYCPFGAFMEPGNLLDPISEYAKLTDNFFIVGRQPILPANIQLKNELVCDQMVIHNKIKLERKEEISRLTDKDNEKLSQLVNLVQPGYFKINTSSLGDYFGIFKNNELVAVTGERMKMNNYTEVSAVVTHPLYTGNGYAKQLVAHTVNNIFDQNKIPYLHVSESNSAAIKLYENLGFVIRRKISFWNLIS